MSDERSEAGIATSQFHVVGPLIAKLRWLCYEKLYQLNNNNSETSRTINRSNCTAMFSMSPYWRENEAYAVITIAIRLRYDYDPTTTYRARLLPFDAIRREQKVNMSIFRRSRIVVESQLWYRLKMAEKPVSADIIRACESPHWLHTWAYSTTWTFLFNEKRWQQKKIKKTEQQKRKTRFRKCEIWDTLYLIVFKPELSRQRYRWRNLKTR